MVILALGNPGEKFSHTRHNAGFLAADALVDKYGKKWKKVWFKPYLYASVELGGEVHHFIKPLTYMNNSGVVLPNLLKKYSEHDFLVLVDNLDLVPGNIRLKRKGGSAGHNGLKSLLHYANDKSFLRLYIGIGRPENGETIVDWVLGEVEDISHDFFKGVSKASEAIEYILVEGMDKAIQRYNRKQDAE